MAIKTNELKKAIRSTQSELDKLNESLFDQIQFDHQTIIGFNRMDKGIVIKIHLNDIQVSICFDYTRGSTIQSDEFNYVYNNPFLRFDEIRFYDRNSNDITEQIDKLIKVKYDGNESKYLIDTLIQISQLTVSNDGVIEYE